MTDFYMKCNTVQELVNEELLSPNIKNSASLIYSLSAKPIKWSNTPKQFVANLPTNGLSVFDHFKIYFKNYYNSLPTSLLNICHVLRNLVASGKY